MTDIESTNINDKIARVSKSIVGMLPIAGPFLSEYVSAVIPNQRIDRLEKLVCQLSSKLDTLTEEKIARNANNPEIIDLFEEGVVQASRALTDHRIDYISSLMKNGMSQDDVNHEEQMRYFSILKELTDTQIILLRYHDLCNQGGDRGSFSKIHGDVLRRRNQSDTFNYELRESQWNHMVQLGLVRELFDFINNPEPKFDKKTGKVERSGLKITELGRRFLESIDQAEPLHPNEVARRNQQENRT